MITAKIKEQLKRRNPFHKGEASGFDEAAGNKLRDISRCESSAFFEKLDSNMDGLTSDQVEEKQNQFGKNEIQHEKPPSWFNQLLRAFIFPFNAVLIIIAAISYITDVLFSNSEDRDYKTVILLSIMILLSSLTREKNYEKILSIYNDCLQGKVNNLFINFAGTKDFLENERRGLFSYQALKSRLETNKFETTEVRDFAQPVIKLMPIGFNEVFALLKKLKDVFDFNYKITTDISDNEILAFMEEMLNKPGALEFLTPREVTRDFLNILSIIRQNPKIDKKKLVGDIKIKDERPNETAVDNIEEI